MFCVVCLLAELMLRSSYSAAAKTCMAGGLAAMGFLPFTVLSAPSVLAAECPKPAYFDGSWVRPELQLNQTKPAFELIGFIGAMELWFASIQHRCELLMCVRACLCF